LDEPSHLASSEWAELHFVLAFAFCMERIRGFKQKKQNEKEQEQYLLVFTLKTPFGISLNPGNEGRAMTN
jgi:hypothetical protein